MTNRHLSSDEISQWVAGDRNVSSEEHLQLCPACRNEVSVLTSVLTDFRGAVHGWSDGCRTSDAPTIRKVQQSNSFYLKNWNWFCLAAAALLIVAVMNFNTRRTLEHEQVAVAQASASDSDVMKQVETELARTVPTSMEPLTQLVSWDDGVTASKSGIQPN